MCTTPRCSISACRDQWFTFNMFDAQAWYVRDIILGRIKVPEDKAVLLADVAEREAREEASDDVKYAIKYQGAYVKELIAETDYPDFDVDGMCKAFFEWKQHKVDNIMGFRDNSYKSLLTGTMAPKHHTAWVEALDDLMETYLRN